MLTVFPVSVLSIFNSIILAVFLLLTACSNTPDEDSDDATAGMSAAEIYREAKNALADSNYDYAIDFFEKLESRYPYGRYAKQAKLEIIYAYYQYEDYDSTIIAADRFIKLYPNHPHVDYAYYLRGVSRFDMQGDLMASLLKQDMTEREPDAAREAFDYFAQLVRRYPDSIYAKDSKKRMLFLRNNLAIYEIHVAKYYFKREAYLASLSRAKYILINYQTTPQVANALVIMVECYKKLNLQNLAADSQRLLDKNYPKHKFTI